MLASSRLDARRPLALVLLLLSVLLAGAPAAGETLVPSRTRAASQAGASAPFLKLRSEPPNVPTDGWPSTLLLAGVGAVGVWAWWRRTSGRRLGALMQARPSPSTLQRLHSQALTPHASVHSVRWNGEEFLVACTSQQVTLLARAPAEAEMEPSS